MARFDLRQDVVLGAVPGLVPDPRHRRANRVAPRPPEAPCVPQVRARPTGRCVPQMEAAAVEWQHLRREREGEVACEAGPAHRRDPATRIGVAADEARRRHPVRSQERVEPIRRSVRRTADLQAEVPVGYAGIRLEGSVIGPRQRGHGSHPQRERHHRHRRPGLVGQLHRAPPGRRCCIRRYVHQHRHPSCRAWCRAARPSAGADRRTSRRPC